MTVPKSGMSIQSLLDGLGGALLQKVLHSLIKLDLIDRESESSARIVWLGH